MSYKNSRHSYRTFSLMAASLAVLVLCIHSRVDAQDKLQEISLNPNVLVSGGAQTIAGRVTLTGNATEELQINIVSDDSVVVDKKVVKVSKGGRESESFLITPIVSAGPQTVKIRATLNEQTIEKTFATFNLLDVQPRSIAGGRQLQANITLPDQTGTPPAWTQVKLYSDSNFIKIPKDPLTIVKTGDRTGYVVLDTVNSLTAENPKGKITATYGEWSQSIEAQVNYNYGRLLLAIFIGLAAIFITFIVFAFLFGQKVSIKSLVMGEDGKPSTSKFQNVLWTFIVVFAYASIALIKLISTGISNLSIDRNVVIVMGATIGTRVLAQAITVNQVAEGSVLKSSWFPMHGDLRANGAVKGRNAYKYLFADDNGRTDLNKIQMLAWTFIAVGIFLYEWYRQLMGMAPGEMNLPVIDGALVVLMGLSQGAYLGGKLVASEGPVIVNLDPESAPAGQEFRINGGPFGNVEGRVTATPVSGGDKQQWGVTKWDPTFVRVRVPAGQAPGSYEIGVIANGQPTMNTKIFKVI